MFGFFNRNFDKSDEELNAVVINVDEAGKLQTVVISDYNTIEGCVADVLVYRYFNGHNWRIMTADYSVG